MGEKAKTNRKRTQNATKPLETVAESQGRHACSFGGRDFKTLHVSAGNNVCRSKNKAEGVQPWAASIVLPPRAAA